MKISSHFMEWTNAENNARFDTASLKLPANGKY